MTKQERKNYIIKSIKEQPMFSNMNPVCINSTDEDINIAMVGINTGCVNYVLRFNVLGGWVIKYDCFDHYTSAYELLKLEEIATNLQRKDAE